MATTTIKIVRSGKPVKGVNVLVGCLTGKPLETNEKGDIKFEMSTGWQVYVDLLMWNNDSIATSSVHLIDGKSYEVEFTPL